MSKLKYKVKLNTAERNWLTDLLRKELQFTNEALWSECCHPYDREVYKEEKVIIESLLVKLGEGVEQNG